MTSYNNTAMNFEVGTCLYWIILLVSFGFMIDGVILIFGSLVHYGKQDQPVVPVQIIESNPCAARPCANGAYCKNDPRGGSKPVGFFCICPRGFRGTHCNYTLHKCSELSCLRTDECWALLDSVLCLCDGPRAPQLCLANSGHSTMMERVSMVVSPRTWCMSRTWLVMLIVTCVLLLILTIHCCKVSRIRRRLRYAANEAVNVGRRPNLPIPNQVEISRDLWKQFFCCRTDSKYLSAYPGNISYNSNAEASDDSADATMDSVASDQSEKKKFPSDSERLLAD